MQKQIVDPTGSAILPAPNTNPVFPRVLVASSLDAASESLIRCAEGLRKLGTTEVLLVCAIDSREMGQPGERLQKLVSAKLEKHKKRLQQLGYAAEARVAFGFPHLDINRLAQENRISLILVQSNAEVVARSSFLGGVAQAVLHRGKKPVLFMPASLVEGDGRTPCESICSTLPRHILFPAVFSVGAEYAFRHMLCLAARWGNTVTLLHVQETQRATLPRKEPEEATDSLEGQLRERFAEKLARAGAARVHIELCSGTPSQKILQRAGAGDISMIVMGSHGRGGAREVLLGTTSHQTVRHSPVPVLLIPAVPG